MSRRILLLLLAAAMLAPAYARGPWRADEDNTRGWELMTPAERIEHQAKIRSFTSLTACEAYRAEHHRLISERAAAQGLTLRGGRRDFCDRLRTSAPVESRAQ